MRLRVAAPRDVNLGRDRAVCLRRHALTVTRSLPGGRRAPRTSALDWNISSGAPCGSERPAVSRMVRIVRSDTIAAATT